MCLVNVTKNAIPFMNMMSIAVLSFLCDHNIVSGIISVDALT